jgi:hypothetical protein
MEEDDDDFDVFFVFEPSAGVELMLYASRANFGISYRIVSGSNTMG